MDDLLELLIVVIVAVVGISKKRKKKQKTNAAKPIKWESIEKTLNEVFEVPAPGKPVQPDPMGEKTHEGIHPCDEHDTTPLVQQPVDYQPVPAVGSLGEDTHEGAHLCDVHNAAPLTDPAPVAPAMPMPEEQPGLQLDWTGDNMVKAFIMQEVLTRPCQRKRA